MKMRQHLAFSHQPRDFRLLIDDFSGIVLSGKKVAFYRPNAVDFRD